MAMGCVMNFMRLLCMCALCLSLFTGCATFEGQLLSPVKEFPTPSVEERPSVAVDLNFRQYLNGAPITLFTKSVESSLEKKCVKRLKGSGLYSRVGTDITNPDLSIHIDMADEGQGSMGMAFLTGLTFYLVPSFTTDTYKLKAEVTNRHTDEKMIVELEEFITQWQQIFLLPLLPFKMLPVVNSRVQNTIFDHLAIESFDGYENMKRNKVGSIPCSQNIDNGETGSGLSDTDATTDKDHVIINVDGTGTGVESALIESFSCELSECFITGGFNVDENAVGPVGRNYILNINVTEFDAGSGVLRATIGFGAGKGIINYDVECSNETGVVFTQKEIKQKFTGMEMSFHSEYGSTVLFGGDKGATMILLKESAKHIFELTQRS